MPGEKILLVDDDPQILTTLQEFLEGQGYAVATAADSRQALDILNREDELHLALVDLRLPEISGLDLLSQIKSKDPDIEVIMFTGYADIDTVLQAMHQGAYDYLIKQDLRLPDLQAIVARSLEHRRLALRNRELLGEIKEARDELARRRAAELAQIRRIGVALACPLSWEQIVEGLLNLIWESIPLCLLGLGLHGQRENLPLEAYRQRPGVSAENLRTFKSCLHDGLERGSIFPDPGQTAQLQALLPGMLWTKVKAGEVLGLLGAARETPFSPEEAELCRIFTLQGESALRNLVLYDQLRNQAIRDPLTGLFNYRYFWDVLHHEIRMSQRYDTPLSLLFMDIDDFKIINDTLGHPLGDLVLKNLAAYLETVVRQADVICRYGGEEFVMLLPQTPTDQALALAERLRHGISWLAVALPGGEIRFTVSIGVAGLKPGMNGEGLVKASDNALYQAKQTGKNRVCQAD
ncbi:MAG: diguanylate cyclase [Deltaproteobacteria bacterium]|nr:diguanylate cyclase [Deltaproteobacteria bacterium]